VAETSTVRKWWRQSVPLIAALAFAMTLMSAAADDPGDERDDTSGAHTMEVAPAARTVRTVTRFAPTAVYAYLEFAGVIGARPHRAMSERHDFCADGLRMLAAALETLAPAYPASVPPARLRGLRAQADRLQDNPMAPKPADQLRVAFIAAAEMLDSAGSHHAAKLRRLAVAIAPDRPIQAQEATVRAFFRQSAAAIRELAIHSPRPL
jgi:hypothetical protein